MLQEALREMGVNDEPRREPIEALLNHAWQDLPLGAATAEHESMSEGVDLGWWSVESRPSQTTRARLVGRLPFLVLIVFRRPSRQTSDIKIAGPSHSGTI